MKSESVYLEQIIESIDKIRTFTAEYGYEKFRKKHNQKFPSHGKTSPDSETEQFMTTTKSI